MRTPDDAKAEALRMAQAMYPQVLDLIAAAQGSIPIGDERLARVLAAGEALVAALRQVVLNVDPRMPDPAASLQPRGNHTWPMWVVKDGDHGAP